MAASSNSIERFGDFLVRIGALSPDAVAEIVARQRETPDRLFGEIAVELGYLSSANIDALLASRRIG